MDKQEDKLSFKMTYEKHLNLIREDMKIIFPSMENDDEKELRFRYTKDEISQMWERVCREVGHEKLIFVMDLRVAAKAIEGETETLNVYSSPELDGKIMVHGAENFLDLKEGEKLNHRKFLSLVYDPFLNFYLEQGRAGYIASQSKEIRRLIPKKAKDLLKSCHVTCLPLKVKPNQNGVEYRWVYQKAYAFQVTREEGYYVSHLNIYTFHEPFNLELDTSKTIPMYYESDGDVLLAPGKALYEILYDRLFKSKDGFNDTYDEILLIGRAAGKSYMKIAEETGFNVDTLKDANKNHRLTRAMGILTKVEFKNDVEMGSYLLKHRIIKKENYPQK